ncbi:hypothetical protein [Clostridium senegalense]|uniref:Flagellar hook-length control protein FliK n=1 Tax=Clostridium senegalense TaxID=1465809 RepID=A0A6M0GZ49_9CLOT|nr:hypothetical protein [Clostridium senegalense]NEU03755.1 hypothetical protein [Clostridium senegalense]
MSGTGVWRIEALQNASTQVNRNKSTFRKGETFTARILNINKESGEVIVRLLDGRQFPARIDNKIENSLIDNYLLKFIVDDFKENKLILSLNSVIENIHDKNIDRSEKEVLFKIINNLGLNISKGDENLIKEMLKFNIPLTQENLDEVKNLLDFKNKIVENPQEEDRFIDKYLGAKNISVNSELGVKTKTILKDFFVSLKTLDLKSMLMMKEENIPINKENINSFNILNEENNVIIKDVKEFEQALYKEKGQVGIKEENFNKVDLISKNKVEEKSNVKTSEYTSEGNGIEKNVKNEVTKENSRNSNVLTLEKEEFINKEIPEKIKLPMHESIKKEIKEKITQMQDSISLIIKEKEDNPEQFTKVMKFLEGKMQDFKMFNTLSNDYYYLNVPMNVKNEDYDCKLVIKDERGKGKKLDSKNMKIATSIKTLNMEVIDAYISVNNCYINIDIQAQKKFMAVIERCKDELLNDLKNLPYSFEVLVNEKVEKFTLSSCRDFFNDESISTLDLMV